MTLKSTEKAENAFNRGGTAIERMVGHLAKDDQKLALIALSAGLGEMCDGLAALAVAIRESSGK